MSRNNRANRKRKLKQRKRNAHEPDLGAFQFLAGDGPRAVWGRKCLAIYGLLVDMAEPLPAGMAAIAPGSILVDGGKQGRRIVNQEIVTAIVQTSEADLGISQIELVEILEALDREGLISVFHEATVSSEEFIRADQIAASLLGLRP